MAFAKKILLSLLISLFYFGYAQAAEIGTIDRVVVYKSKAQMQLLRNGKVITQYKIAMGDNPVGHKYQEGDQRTPEGIYELDYKKADSAYYKAIHISYPNFADRFRAEALGINPGGMIMIHGQKPDNELSPEQAQQLNWTDGCIAITNEQIDQLWQAIEVGTPIEIWP